MNLEGGPRAMRAWQKGVVCALIGAGVIGVACVAAEKREAPAANGEACDVPLNAAYPALDGFWRDSVVGYVGVVPQMRTPGAEIPT